MITKNLQNRRFTVVSVPEPIEIGTKFVYNFFVPDERENDNGDMRVPGLISDAATQRLIDAKTLSTEIPRYVEIFFSPGTPIEFGNFGDSKNFIEDFSLEQIINEETITNESFFALRESDDGNQNRMKQKLEALSKVLDIKFEDSDQTKTLSDITKIEKEHLLPLVSPYGDSLQVNFVPNDNIETLYSNAAKNSLNSLINKRLGEISVTGINDISPLGGIEVRKEITEATKNFLASCQDNSITLGDVEPTFHPFLIEDVDSKTSTSLLGASHIGYVLSRKQHAADGKNIGEMKNWTIFGRDNTTFLDSEILYGTKYAYSVRNVFRIDAVIDFLDDGIVVPRRISCLIASKPTKYSSVVTEENVAPEPPDGIFYRFNYDNGKGLIITWQIPPGRSRDVKYFQIFKRSSIYEPFTCISELDFDDSHIRTLKSETVREDLIKKFQPGFAINYFEDKSFNRETPETIYAVCAVDAHGLTSCYSTQTKVGFDKISNRITLKNISRPGAPKQYPNFFIDPRMDENVAVDSFTQDAIFDSGHTRFDIYFTPDAIKAKNIAGDETNVFVSENQGGSYSMHVINLDLQKSDTATISVNDLRKLI